MMTLMDNMACLEKKFRNKVGKLLRDKRTSLARLFVLNQAKDLHKAYDYEALANADPHQEELDENALNEALEARLMGLIALVAGAHPDSQPLTITVGNTAILALAAPDPFDSELVDNSGFCTVPGTFRSCCQLPQSQAPPAMIAG